MKYGIIYQDIVKRLLLEISTEINLVNSRYYAVFVNALYQYNPINLVRIKMKLNIYTMKKKTLTRIKGYIHIQSFE